MKVIHLNNIIIFGNLTLELTWDPFETLDLSQGKHHNIIQISTQSLYVKGKTKNGLEGQANCALKNQPF